MQKPNVQACQQNLFEIEPAASQPKQKQERDFAFDIVDALKAPVLTFSQLWADMIPERILNIIPMARLIALKTGAEMATYPECVAYMYTRSLESPMDSEWVDIYTHVSCKTVEDWFNENRWDYVKAPAVLSQWLESKLTDLRKHIYKKRREILTSRTREEEKTQTKIPAPEKPIRQSPANAQPQQKSLF